MAAGPEDQFPVFVPKRPVFRIHGEGVRRRVLRGDADFKDRIQTGFIIADHLRQTLPDGAFVFAGNGEVDTGVLPSTPYDMHEIISRVVDRSSLVELQSSFAPNAIVGFARMDGSTVGIVAQEPSVIAGVIDIDAADKIFRFVRLCDCYNIPLVTFVDSPGFLPGVNQEHRGIIRHGAKVLFAYADATVPKVSIVTRKAYGGAYVVMSSKYLGTDMTYAWPSAEIAVMGPEGATNILYRKQIEEAKDKEAERKRLTDQFREQFLNPYAAAQAGYIDEVIEPCETRAKVISALAALREKQLSTPNRKHGNIPV